MNACGLLCFVWLAGWLAGGYRRLVLLLLRREASASVWVCECDLSLVFTNVPYTQTASVGFAPLCHCWEANIACVCVWYSNCTVNADAMRRRRLRSSAQSLQSQVVADQHVIVWYMLSVLSCAYRSRRTRTVPSARTLRDCECFRVCLWHVCSVCVWPNEYGYCTILDRS